MCLDVLVAVVVELVVVVVITVLSGLVEVAVVPDSPYYVSRTL